MCTAVKTIHHCLVCDFFDICHRNATGRIYQWLRLRTSATGGLLPHSS
uniref:Uncharacterized protein n=1 Tax=Anguilla anguilla TaxID=7936 RepID=A0A0E9TM95_ANGAN